MTCTCKLLIVSYYDGKFTCYHTLFYIMIISASNTTCSSHQVIYNSQFALLFYSKGVLDGASSGF